MKSVNVSRRDFLQQMGLSATGLCIGMYSLNALAMGGKSIPERPAKDKDAPLFSPNAFVHISTTGLVTLYCHRSEMGQGVRSTLPVILADELGTNMQHVEVIQAVGDKKYGDQNTDGSSSIRGVFDWLRGMSATARTILIQVAAKRWKVSPDECDTEDNYVYLKSNRNKKIAFGELVEEASSLPVPSEDQIKLRDLKQLKNVGTDLPLYDGLDYITGRAVYGADVVLPEMTVAIIQRPPVVGGKVKSFDDSEAKKVSGVVKIIKMPEPVEPYAFQPWGGVAVIATNTWAAESAREKLKIVWDHGANDKYDSVAFKKELFNSVKKGGKSYRKFGDADKALKESKLTHSAEYYVPHLPHLTMEPAAAIASYKSENGGFCEVWAATQNPQAARTEVARVLGLSEDKVQVNVTLLGGGFGRKSKPDFCGEAAWLARELKRPVRVQFTREDDIHNDYVNTVNAQVIQAGLDAEGKLHAWKRQTAFPPIGSTFVKGLKTPAVRDFQQGILDLAINAKNFDAQACDAVAHARIGWLRSVYNIFHSFATNSFLDELAHKANKDSLEFMLSVYVDGVVAPEDSGIKEMHNYGLPIDKYPVDGKRLRGVLVKAAEMANWKSRKSDKERGYGIATHRSFLSYVGVAVAVKKSGDEFLVDEVWIAIDAGTVMNTERVRSQMEGSVINGMSHFFYGGLTYKDGAVEQSNFHDMQQVRLDRAPRKINVEIVNSGHAAGGVGEPGVPPVAPAIANAIFDLSKIRIREFASEKTGWI